MRALIIIFMWVRYRLACRALNHPFDPAASLRLDKALLALERALEAS